MLLNYIRTNTIIYVQRKNVSNFYTDKNLAKNNIYIFFFLRIFKNINHSDVK